jgi:tetrahedral aminopeptidase
MSPQAEKTFRAGKAQLALLEELTNLDSVSGDEAEVREFIRKQVAPLADEIKVDAMGNLLVIKHAKKPGALKVMLDAHMDEVGFMIVNEDGDGLYEFEQVGGGDERQFIAKAVRVGRKKIPAVIGSKPIHLTNAEERKTPISMHDMRIDLSPAGKGKAKRGDFAAYTTKFIRSGDAIFAKALDNRLGCATLIELLRSAPETIELLTAFTVQEELGLRGAKIAAYDFNPDLAIAVDSTPAHDLPRPDGNENTQYNCRIGGGPAMYLADAGMLSDPRLVRFLTRVAEENHLPLQCRQPGGGGTDAGALHKTRGGIPAISVSVPGRYAHTAVMMCRISDWENTVRLLQNALIALTPEIITGTRA